MPGSAQLKYIVLSILFVVAAVNFTRTTIDVIKSSRRLDELHSELSVLEQKKANLTEDLQYKQTNEYVEEKARNELNLVKPGESVYVVVDSAVAGAEDSRKVETANGVFSGSRDENWYQWYALFF